MHRKKTHQRQGLYDATQPRSFVLKKKSLILIDHSNVSIWLLFLYSPKTPADKIGLFKGGNTIRWNWSLSDQSPTKVGQRSAQISHIFLIKQHFQQWSLCGTVRSPSQSKAWNINTQFNPSGVWYWIIERKASLKFGSSEKGWTTLPDTPIRNRACFFNKGENN